MRLTDHMVYQDRDFAGDVGGAVAALLQLNTNFEGLYDTSLSPKSACGLGRIIIEIVEAHMAAIDCFPHGRPQT